MDLHAGIQVELLHMYVAMGLSKQHYLQRMCLARVRDFALLRLLADVVQDQLRVNRRVVRAIHQSEAENELLRRCYCATALEGAVDDSVLEELVPRSRLLIV